MGELLREMSGSPGSNTKKAMEDFLHELQSHNPFFESISTEMALEMLKRCEILIFDNEFIYKEGDTTDACFLVLYGEISLGPNGSQEAWETCRMGDTLAEEIIVSNQKMKRYKSSFRKTQ